MKTKPSIPSVNFHLWEPCNMRCKFCFATFQDVKRSILPKGHLQREDVIEVIKRIAEFGFEKITFAGGEPTLCPWLPQLVKTAKLLGMTTMIVTNGSKISSQYLMQFNSCLDWVALSIDSISESTNLKSGRALLGKKNLTTENYLSICKQIKEHGIGLKINTVVHRLNLMEDISDFILAANPKRWKILQALQIDGQNNLSVHDLDISTTEFNTFIERHRETVTKTVLIPENNEEMAGSYVMIDPAGRFFDNLNGAYSYSDGILDVGVENALNQIRMDKDMFLERGGLYNW